MLHLAVGRGGGGLHGIGSCVNRSTDNLFLAVLASISDSGIDPTIIWMSGNDRVRV